MPEFIYRLLAFLGKEFHDVRRQPRLILSLLLGPFLILFLFGIGYQSRRDPPRVVLVLPAEFQDEARLAQIEGLINQNAQLVAITDDEQSALSRLKAGEIDVVEIVPANFEATVTTGQQATLTFTYAAIDPRRERYLQYVGHTHVTALNDALLIRSMDAAQERTNALQQQIDSTRPLLDQMQSGLANVDEEEVLDSLSSLTDALDRVADHPALSAAEPGSDLAAIRDRVVSLRDNLLAIQDAIASGSLVDQDALIDEAQDELIQLESDLNQLQNLRPQIVAAPLRQQNINLEGEAYSAMVYFAPGVAVLILQHIAVTLAALSLVRERYNNALAFFSVSPTSMLEVLLGKYVAYLTFLSVISASLTLLLHLGLNVPFLGSVTAFAGFTVLFLLASLGLGFLISVLSDSETQAVQLAMLSLLLTVFFSGFVLPLERFVDTVQVVGYIVPMTHTMQGFQAIMLEGLTPTPNLWLALTTLAVTTFSVVTVVWHRQGQRLS